MAVTPRGVGWPEWRARYDAIIDKLIDDELGDPYFEDRNDVLALMLRSTYEDGSAMSREDIGDELLTLLAAGHETTASALAWTFERVSRHPEVLAGLAAEADTDDNELRQATILESQRSRTVIDAIGRHVHAPAYELGEWSIPRGHTIIVSISRLHGDPELFPEPERFDPQRFVGTKPPSFAWIPYGGGTRRCVGAVFANVEMDVVLRTVLRHFTIEATRRPGRSCMPAVSPTPRRTAERSWFVGAKICDRDNRCRPARRDDERRSGIHDPDRAQDGRARGGGPARLRRDHRAG